MYILEMKSTTFNIVISVIVVSVIIISLMCSCSKVRPYSPNNIFSHEYPYEGFANLEYLNTVPKTNDLLANNHLLENPNAAECKKVDGFDGLFCKPFVADNKIDKFSGLKGDPKCFGQSSGLSNSMGSLCLGEDLNRLMRTRGGNQSSGPDKIGV
jgi:hypothetical protein